VTRSLEAAELKAIGRASGLDAVGITRAEPFVRTRRDLDQRRAAGLHGGMEFTYRKPERSTDPLRALDGARSIVVGALAYPAPPTRSGSPHAHHARAAAYASDDHYATLRAALDVIADALRAAGSNSVVLVDDNALVDREAAYRAGLGWYGKNSNVLLPGRGSWFVLGSVITTATLEVDDALADREAADGCGSCRRCIDGCPTNAIVAPGVVDARRCLAWLLQARGDFPVEYRAALGDRLYGCDECQEVCPPNRRAPRGVDEAPIDVLELLDADDETILARHGRWYIPDRDPRYVRRNALVVLGNVAAPDDVAATATLARYARSPDPMLRSHAEWAVARVAERAAR
jgi:epoxyqueuosine reductase